jgi:hypothetical protein
MENEEDMKVKFEIEKKKMKKKLGMLWIFLKRMMQHCRVTRPG